MTTLSLNRGYLSLVGTSVDAVAKIAIDMISLQDIQTHMPFHITILTKDELRSSNNVSIEEILNKEHDNSFENKSPTGYFVPLGIGRIGKNVYYVIVAYPFASHVRKSLNLPNKHFHITLSAIDIHDEDKGMTTMLNEYHFSIDKLDVDNILSCPQYASDAGVIQHLFRIHKSEKLYHILSLLKNDDGDMLDITLETIKEFPSWCAPYLFHGKYLMNEKQWKKAMITLCIGWCNAKRPSQKDYILKQLIKCNEHTEWGTAHFEEIDGPLEELEELHAKFNSMCPFPELGVGTDFVSQLSIEPRLKCHVFSESKIEKLPRFFRWIVPFSVAIMSTPKDATDVTILSNAPFNIERIVTLTVEEPLLKEWFPQDGSIQNVFLPVENYKAPTIPQVNHFIDLVCKERKRTLVHCGGGKGRAGTVIACFLAASGFTTEILPQPRFTANEVITLMREMRPGSIETVEQEKFIKDYISYLWKKCSPNDEMGKVNEPTGEALHIEGRFTASSNFIVLCGLQGSGKSTFAQNFEKLNYEILSQDRLGSKKAFLDRFSQVISKSKTKVIIDKCNINKKSRKEILSFAMNPADSMCVYFDYPADLCIQRADLRMDHPTIKAGLSRVPIKSMAKMHEKPTLSEGFQCVVTVRSIDSCNALLRKFGIMSQGENAFATPMVSTATTFHKFPRTRHIVNTGAASRDDLVLSKMEAETFLKLQPGESMIVQEKIDGANMGITIDKDSLKFKVQNRSHYVSSKDHVQFKPLDNFLENKREELWRILTADETLPPGRLILFGEWMVAKHSIHYTKLPSVFVAFDIYDTTESTFFSYPKMMMTLDGTNIPTVPVLRTITCSEQICKEDLVNMIKKTSAFYDGVIEGIVIRKENQEQLLDRAKIVRKDFICGNEHWSKGIITLNGVERLSQIRGRV